MPNPIRYGIPCEHETKNLPTSVIVSDYHPLDRESLLQLLRRASTVRGDPYRFSDIQCRVVQGLPGLTCPNQIHGSTAKKIFIIDDIFQKILHDNINEITDKIMKMYGD